MIQAEDRAHRIGQKEKYSINCHYIYGEDTLDALMFDKLEAKLAVVSDIIDGEDTLNAEKTNKMSNDYLLFEDTKVKNEIISKEAAYELTGIKKTPTKAPSIISYFQPIKKDDVPPKVFPRKNLEETKETSTAEAYSYGGKGPTSEMATNDIFEDDYLLDEIVETMLQESRRETPVKSDAGKTVTKITENIIRPKFDLFEELDRGFPTPNIEATVPQNDDKSRSGKSTLEKKKTGGFLFTKEMVPSTKILSTTAESSPAKVQNQTAVNSLKNMLFDCEATKRPRPGQEQPQPEKTDSEFHRAWSKEEDDDFFGISKKVKQVKTFKNFL